MKNQYTYLVPLLLILLGLTCHNAMAGRGDDEEDSGGSGSTAPSAPIEGDPQGICLGFLCIGLRISPLPPIPQYPAVPSYSSVVAGTGVYDSRGDKGLMLPMTFKSSNRFGSNVFIRGHVPLEFFRDGYNFVAISMNSSPTAINLIEDPNCSEVMLTFSSKAIPPEPEQDSFMHTLSSYESGGEWKADLTVNCGTMEADLWIGTELRVTEYVNGNPVSSHTLTYAPIPK